jgi:ATP-dependent Zn protease
LPHSEKLLDSVEETTRTILQKQLDRAVAIVEARRSQIDRLVEELLVQDTLNQAEIRACFPDDARAAQA